MSTPLDLVVVHSPVGGGHKAAALATAEAARARGLSVEVVDLFALAPRFVGEAYLRAHLTGQGALPDLYGPLYFAANRRGGAFEPVRHAIDHAAFGALETRVRELAPRVVIATHHLPLVVLGEARRRGRLDAPLVGVVTDYTAHACWAEPGVDRFAVPCALARRELVEHGVDARAVQVTGIPVRPAFDAIPALAAPRPGERLRVLVTSGGFGVGPLARVVSSFAAPGVRETTSLVVVCGNAPDRVARIRRLAARKGIDAEVVGFERDMARRVAAAHVVVGKAGGLTVSETLAGARPMIVVGAVPGNETLNERFVVQGGAGYASAPRDVGALAVAMHERGSLLALGTRARALVVSHAADRVVDLALSLGARGPRTSLAA